MFVTSMLRRRSRGNRAHKVPILRLPVLSSASSRILSSQTSPNPDDQRSLQVGITRDLAEFAVKTSFADLPAEVVHETKRDIINVLGVAIYSARDPSLQAMFAMFDAEGGNPRATVW